jgi:hypothetical protein
MKNSAVACVALIINKRTAAKNSRPPMMNLSWLECLGVAPEDVMDISLVVDTDNNDLNYIGLG